MKTLIFDNSAGRLQWISSREIYRETLVDASGVRCRLHIGPLNPADWKFYRVRDEKVREIADWHEHGGAARRVAA